MKLESSVNCNHCISKDVCKYKVSMQNALPVIEKQCENIGSIAVLSLRCDHYHEDLHTKEVHSDGKESLKRLFEEKEVPRSTTSKDILQSEPSK